MPIQGKTTFSEASYQPESPRESYTPDSSGATRYIRIVDTLQNRHQAALDFLGYNTLATANITTRTQTLTLQGAPTGGTVTLQTTNPLTGGNVNWIFNYDESIDAAEVELMDRFGLIIPEVSGTGWDNGTTLILTFEGDLATTPLIVMTANNLTGGTTPTVNITSSDSTVQHRYISRQLPASYPSGVVKPINPQGNPWRWCVSIPMTRGLGVKVENGAPAPHDFGAGLAQYGLCEMTLQFKTLRYALRADSDVRAQGGPLTNYPDEGWCLQNNGWQASRYITRTQEDGSRFLTLSGTVQYFPSDKSKVPQGQGLQESYTNVLYLWHQVPLAARPTSAIRACQDKVNDAFFDGFGRGTLLFCGMAEEYYKGPLGDDLLDIRYRFKHVSHVARYTGPAGTQLPGEELGHNSYLRFYNNFVDGTRVCDYDSISADENGKNPIIPYADFGSLFRPDQS